MQRLSSQTELQSVPDTSKEYPEEPFNLHRFLSEGVIPQLLLPIFYVRYSLEGNESALRNLCSPLSTFTAEMPVLWFLALMSLISIIIIGSTAPERSLAGHVNVINVSLGDNIVALSTYLLVVVAAALSTAHAPRQYETIAAMRSPQQAAEKQPTRFRPTRLSGSVAEESAIGSKLSSENESAAPEQQEFSSAAAPRANGDAGNSLPNEAQTATEMPTRFSNRVPYINVLFDEVPPLLDDCSFVFASESWFFPSRSNALYDRMHIHLDAAPFKFNIGQQIVRNNVAASAEDVDFGGELGVIGPNQVVTVSNRMWRESQACYALEGGDPDLQFQPIETFFTPFDVSALGRSEADAENVNPNAMTDRIISSETMLVAMSKREILHRSIHDDDGNFSGYRPVVVPKWASQGYWMLSITIVFVPMILRGFAGVSPIGQATAGEVIGCFFPMLLNFLCLATLGRILVATAISMWNLLDWITAFTEVTLNGYPCKWHSTLSFTDSINVHSWYSLRDHLIRVFQVGMRARCCLAGMVALHSVSWGAYFVAYTIVPWSRKFVDGWLLQQMIISGLLLIGSCVIFLLCHHINACFANHAQFFSAVKVFVDEEVGALQRRQQRVSAFRDRSGSSRNNPLALEEVQGVITDVAFALHNESAPLRAFGIDLSLLLVFVLGTAAVLTIVCVVQAVAAMSTDSTRWGSVRSL